MAGTDKLFSRLDALFDRVDRILPTQTDIKTSEDFQAYRWHDSNRLDSTMVDGQLHPK